MKRSQTGFTLVEIAIVLVIIGLLLGGILKGQEMIVSGQVRNAINQGEAVTAAVFAFQDRFKSLPGDYSQAAANIPSAVNCGGGRCGNGIIDQNSERGLAWQQLAQAGFLSGTYDGAAVRVGGTRGWTCSQTTCPPNAFGGTMLLNTGIEAQGASAARGELYSGQNIPIAVMAEMDRKIDDGLPITGSFRVSITHAANCATGTAVTDVYDIANKPDEVCGGVYRNF